ncbi:MAG: glucan biosynthesis protein G [Chromatiaceae bacterium]
MGSRVFGILIGCLVILAPAVDYSARADGGPTGAAAPLEKKGVTAPFNFATVVRLAAALASGPFEPDRPELPPALASLDYDQYRDVRFRREKSLWRAEDLPFQVELFPRGFMFHDRVKMNVVEDNKVVPIQFQRDLYDYGKNNIPADLPTDLGFAGLRLLYPINRSDTFDEVAVFLGASYFRAVARNLNYGITARGLAIDTGLPSKEEFPAFREFWLVKPAPDATSLTLYALLDGESVTGAYRFIIEPGRQTVMEVKAHLYTREGVRKLGIAPLTSMFFHGEDRTRFMDDFRPEVHDSDGLIVETGAGERIWRPLVNPLGLRINGFQVNNPRSFGLLQRDRSFDHYQDLEAHYQNRPSALVEPIGRDAEEHLQGGRTLSTRIGAGGTDVPDPKVRKFVIDFAGPALAESKPDKPVQANVVASSGALSKAVVEENPHTKGQRLFFELTPKGDAPVGLRAFLYRGNDVLSETWSFQWVRSQ